MSETILAKFKVGSVTNFGNNNLNVNLSPVTSGSDENKSFSLYTPTGKIEMHITNPDVIGFFIPGEEYFVEFKLSTAIKLGDKVFLKSGSPALKVYCIDQGNVSVEWNDEGGVQIKLFPVEALSKDPNLEVKLL